MALYDLSKKIDQDRCKQRLLKLYEKGAMVELKEKQDGTNNQNSYFHLICSYFALQYGETMEYVKIEIVKKLVCKELFATEYTNRHNGEIRSALRSWKDLDKEERSLAIDKFLDWSAKEAGIRLPEPEDEGYIKEVKIEVDRNRKYL